MILHGYPRSSAAYRVRIALAMKNLEPERLTRHLLRNEHLQPDFLELNPQGFVPALQLDDGSVLTQSLAIIEYLDESYPDPPLLPPEPAARARVRALALLVACDVHPLNNLRVLRYLETALGQDKERRDTWYRHWIGEGFKALEQSLAADTSRGLFCHGDTPTLADVCLVPQVANARRYSMDLTPYPLISQIDSRCRGIAAFAAAAE
jgi:maleylacetoacetate isomerase